MLRRRSYNLHNDFQKTMWSQIKCYPGSAKLGNTRKNCPNFFLIEKNPFSEKLLSSTSQVLNKWFQNVHNICQNTLWTLLICSLKFFILLKTRKSRRKLFFQRKKNFFLQQNCVFNNFYVLKNDPKTSRTVVSIPSEPWKLFFWHLSYSIKREEKAKINFFHWKVRPPLQKMWF